MRFSSAADRTDTASLGEGVLLAPGRGGLGSEFDGLTTLDDGPHGRLEILLAPRPFGGGFGET